MPALVALHKTNPKTELLKKVGNIDWLKLRANQVLCAVYIRPNEFKIKGGTTLYLPDKTVDEDRFQSKVGLIIKMGPLAFVDDENTKFLDADKCKLHDWIVYRASDGWMMTITGDGSESGRVLCRVFVESDVRAVISEPDAIW